MKRKKMLFVCYGLGIGGIETCLVNLLNALPESRFQIDVLLMNPEYESKERIRTSVRYLDAFRYVMNTTDTMKQIKEHGGILKCPGKFLAYCCFRMRVKLQLNAWKSFKRLPDHYDIAVAYSQNDYSPYYVIDKVDADRKVMWYHNGAYKANGKMYKRDMVYYGKFDYIVAVSSDCKKILQQKFNYLRRKIIVLQNVCDVSEIKKKADLFLPITFKKNKIHIVTVGRLTSEKGADLAVEVCRRLCEKNLLIQWHWVGDGNQRTMIENKVKKYGIENYFVIEGKQTNPYPYIKSADIYVQPSYYEAYSTTVTEAKVLNKPIVVTNVGGMNDQLKNGITGYIVNTDAESIENVLLKIIKNKNLCQCLINNLGDIRYDSTTILQEYFDTVFK